MGSAKPNQKIHVDKLETTLTFLDQLDKKEQEELTLRESIYFLRDKLRSALKKGYSYQDLSELLEQQQILVSAATLKQYLTESSKEANARKRGAKSGQAKKIADDKQTILTGTKESDTSVVEAEEFKEEIREETLETSQSVNTINKADTLNNLEEADTNNLSQDSEQNLLLEGQEDSTNKTVKGRGKRINKQNPDLASEFNQY